MRATKMYGDTSCYAFRDNLQNRDKEACRELYYTIIPLMGEDAPGLPIIERSCDLSKYDEYYKMALASGIGVRVILQNSSRINDVRSRQIFDLYPDMEEETEAPRVIRLPASEIARGMGQAPQVDLQLLEQKHQYELKIQRLNQECEDLKRENMQLERAAEAREKEWQAVFTQSERMFADKNARIAELEELVSLYKDIATKATSTENMLGLNLKETVQSVVRSSAMGLAGYFQGMTPRQAAGLALQGLAGFGMVADEEVKEAPIERPQSTIKRKEHE